MCFVCVSAVTVGRYFCLFLLLVTPPPSPHGFFFWPCHTRPLNGILNTEAEISVRVFGKDIVLVSEEVVCKHYETTTTTKKTPLASVCIIMFFI